MAAVGELVAYPPIRDAISWISDYKPRSEMTPEELAARHRLDRETRRRMRERMAADPEYREARLEVGRRGAATWRARNRDNPDIIAKRRARDRTRWQRDGAELKADLRRAYVGERAERIREKNRAWYADNREARRAYSKAHRATNGDAIRTRDRERERREYAQDPKKFNDYMKAWRAKTHLRRAHTCV